MQMLETCLCTKLLSVVPYDGFMDTLLLLQICNGGSWLGQ